MAIGTGAAILGSSLIGAGSSLLGNKKKQTATNTNTPPAFLQPGLNLAAGNAEALYRSGGPQLWDQSTVAPLSDQTRSFLSQYQDRAQDGSPLVGAAQDFVQNGLSAQIQSPFGSATNPYAQSVGGGASVNPYAQSIGGGSSANPYSQSIGGGAAANPYASAANPYGSANNPYLDATFNKAALATQNQLDSQYARAGRNVGAGEPIRAQQLNDLATSIYGGAYENERNRGLGFDQQLLGIGASGFENAQSRNLQAGLAAQGIGAQGFENAQGRNLQAGLAAQGIGAQGFENAQSRNLQADLSAQNIGAQGFENAQNRSLTDIGQQRSLQQGLLGSVLPLANQDYSDLENLGRVGGVFDSYNQAILTDQVNRYNEQQSRPYANLSNYISQLGQLGGNYGTQTSTQPGAQSNVLGSAIGGGLLGANLFGSGGIFGNRDLSNFEITGAAANGGYRYG